jgi:hypothetical protein
MNTKTVDTPLQLWTKQVDGIARVRGIHERWPQLTVDVQDDREELHRRFLDLLTRIGDVAAYSDGRLPNAIRAAIAEKIVTLGEVNRIMATHQLPEITL